MVEAADADLTHFCAAFKLTDLVGVAPSPFKIGRNDKLLRLDQCLFEMKADTTLSHIPSPYTAMK
jgi:hypothetical protein